MTTTDRVAFSGAVALFLFSTVLVAAPSDAFAACDPLKTCDQTFRQTIPDTMRSDYSAREKWDRISDAIKECWDCAKENMQDNLRGGGYYGNSSARPPRYSTPSRGGARQ